MFCPPAELHLSYGLLSADKLILEIRGHFLCLLAISTKKTHKRRSECSLRELMSARVEHLYIYVNDLWLQTFTQLKYSSISLRTLHMKKDLKLLGDRPGDGIRSTVHPHPYATCTTQSWGRFAANSSSNSEYGQQINDYFHHKSAECGTGENHSQMRSIY